MFLNNVKWILKNLGCKFTLRTDQSICLTKLFLRQLKKYRNRISCVFLYKLWGKVCLFVLSHKMFNRFITIKTLKVS